MAFLLWVCLVLLRHLAGGSLHGSGGDGWAILCYMTGIEAHKTYMPALVLGVCAQPLFQLRQIDDDRCAGGCPCWDGGRMAGAAAAPMNAISRISGSRLCHWRLGLTAAACLNYWSYLDHAWPLPSLARFTMIEL